MSKPMTLSETIDWLDYYASTPLFKRLYGSLIIDVAANASRHLTTLNHSNRKKSALIRKWRKG